MKNEEKKEIVEKGINFATSQLKQKLIDDINEFHLPIVITNAILHELANDINNLTIQQVQKEKMEYEEKLHKEIINEEGKNK